MAKQQESKPEGSASLIVEGTGKPDIDVRAVQDAVNNAAIDQKTVYLKGAFSFGPTGSVKIENRVRISDWNEIPGARAETMPATIYGGKSPFLVKAQGQPVEIYGVHFVNPLHMAIQILQVKGLEIARCRIEKVQAYPAPDDKHLNATGIAITGLQPGANIAGTLSILNNEIDVGGREGERTRCVRASLNGFPTEHTLIAGNRFKNFTAAGIWIFDVEGKATIERNLMETSLGGEVGNHLGTEGIRCTGSGKYLITENTIRISVQPSISRSAGILLAVSGAAVTGNNITVVKERIGIDLIGGCNNNNVSYNTILGYGRCALNLASDPQSQLSVDANTLQSNHHTQFTSSLADIVIGERVTNTRIIGGPGTIIDGSTGTTILGSYRVEG